MALLVFPAVGWGLHLSQNQFGLWAALAIHDTSSVVGAAAKYGNQALAIGTTVKLARALWIVPLSLLTASALFDRGGGHIQLTPGGKALVPFADKLKVVAEEAVQAVAAAYGEQGGELALGASQTIAQYLLPALIAAFRKSHPKVRVTALRGNTDAMLEALVAGKIQLALIEGPERRKDLQIEAFMEDHMVLVVPAGHEWAGQEITAAMIREQPLLMREFGSGSRRVIEQALAASGLKPKDLQIGMEFDSTEGLLSAVEAGLGVTFVSRWAVRNQLALGTLRLAYARELKLSRWFSLARASGPEPKGNVEAFRALLLSPTLELPSRLRGRSAPSRKGF